MSFDIICILKDLEKEDNLYSIIASYFLSLTPKQIEKLKMKDVENACHVSSPSIVRFCKKCGVYSFSRFKYEFYQQKLFEDETNNLFDIHLFSQSSSYKMIVEDTIDKTTSLLTNKRISTFISLLNESSDINIFAGGSSYFAAEDLERKLSKVEKHATAYNDEYWMRFSITNAKADTLFIGITYSGMTKKVISQLKHAKEKGYKTILVTSDMNAHMEKEYDLVLYVSSSEIRDRLVNTSSRIGVLFVFDVVYYAYIAECYPKYFEKYKELKA